MTFGQLEALLGVLAVIHAQAALDVGRADHRGQVDDVLGPEHEVQVRETRQQPVSLLLRHAASHADDETGAALLERGECPQINSVDHYTRNVMGIMGEFCTIVRGS